MKVSAFIAGRLVELGVRHVFGVGGANIEDMFAAIQRRRPEIRMVLGKHEHAAGTAADAYARLTGGLGVVFVTSGGGAMNLVHSLAEARASAVPVLAIVGEPPTEVQGLGAFQDTSGRGGAIDAALALGAVAVWCKRVAQVEQIPRLLSEALDTALGAQPGPAVLLLAKDLQRSELTLEPPGSYAPPEPMLPDPVAIQRAARLLRAGPVLIFAGDEVARAKAGKTLASIADALGAQVAVTPEARDAFDNYSASFVGVSGTLGSRDVERTLAQANTCLVVGTRLPVLARQGLEGLLAEKPLISLGREPPFVTPERALHVEASLLQGLHALCAELGAPFLSQRPKSGSRDLSSRRLQESALTSRSALGVIEAALPEGSTVIVDAGNVGAAAVHHLRLPPEARWLQAMGMAGMGYSFGAAVGAAFATGRRCFVLAGDGAFFMNGLDVHTAVEHQLPITYVIFNNRAHGMCLVRERLLLGENAGYNAFRLSHIGAGLGAMLPGLTACDCRTVAELANAFERAARSSRPSLIAIQLDHVEIPPFAGFQQLSPGLSSVSRGGPDEEH